MPVSQRQLFELLDQLGIEHRTVEHRPLFTVEEGKDLHHAIPGLHCKSLFLENKNKAFWLVVMPGEKRANLSRIGEILGSGRLSFAGPDMLLEKLGITPGSVTPFALMNDLMRCITVVLDKDILQSDMVNFHPLRNNASTAISSAGLVRFIKALGYEPVVIDCG